MGGSVPANNYIMLPKSSSQSLGLTGHFFYLLFRPLSAKYFVIHLEVVTPAAMVIRISFSNLFKEFKSTSTSLQFPYRHGQSESGVIGGGRVSSSKNIGKWTFLCIDLREILSRYLSCSYSHTRNIKLCANILVKNAFTSNLEYSPLEEPGTKGSSYLQAPPREMCLPKPPMGAEFLEVYNYVRFPISERQSKGTVGDHYQPKLLRGVKPGAVLVAVSEEKESASVKEDGRNPAGKEQDRTGVRSPRKSPRPAPQLSADGGGLEYYVEREMDRELGKWIPPHKERSSGVKAPAIPRMANHSNRERDRVGQGDEVAAKGERVRPTVTWSVTPNEGGRSEEKRRVSEKWEKEATGDSGEHRKRGNVRGVVSGGTDDGDIDQRDGLHIHMDRGTKVILTTEGCSTSSSVGNVDHVSSVGINLYSHALEGYNII